jgi:hypothetical protein
MKQEEIMKSLKIFITISFLFVSHLTTNAADQNMTVESIGQDLLKAYAEKATLVPQVSELETKMAAVKTKEDSLMAEGKGYEKANREILYFNTPQWNLERLQNDAKKGDTVAQIFLNHYLIGSSWTHNDLIAGVNARLAENTKNYVDLKAQYQPKKKALDEVAARIEALENQMKVAAFLESRKAQGSSSGTNTVKSVEVIRSAGSNVNTVNTSFHAKDQF